MATTMDLVRAHLEAEDRRDVEGALTSFSDDCSYRMDTFGIDLRGKPAIADHYRGAFKAMPNFANDKNGEMFDGGDDVFRLGYFQVTQSGPWKDLPASGRDVKVWVLAHFPRAPDGQLGGESVWFNGNDFLHQLGHLPSANAMELARYIKELEDEIAKLESQ
jgi:steroid delta-isomerase-like uncharacterized protein